MHELHVRAELKKPRSGKACAGLLKITPKGYDGARMQTAKLTKADGSVVCARCHLAVRPWSRMRGLLGRASLDADEGMLFRPASSIHMMFMRFTIDAVFLDRELVVVDVVRSLKPWRMASRRGSKVVVELAEGAADAAGVRSGDQLVLATIDA